MTAGVRLVATDLDGTLLRPDGRVSARTRRVLRRVRAAGIAVVLVTARPPATLRLLAREAGVSGLAICANGALVYDLDRDEVVRHHPLAGEAARRLVLALREAAPGVCFAFVRGAGFACEPDYHAGARVVDHGEALLAAALLDDALVLCAEPATKLIARHPELDPDALLARVRALGLDGFEATHSGAPFVEIAAAGVTKAWALAALCADLGVTSGEVVAFGDAPNDLPLLRWAGRGVAVANAHPAVLAAVAEVTDSNAADGVARTLELLLHESPAAPRGGAPAGRRHTGRELAPIHNIAARRPSSAALTSGTPQRRRPRKEGCPTPMTSTTDRPMAFEGGCYCGAVRYRVGGIPSSPTICHCADCRRAAGAPFVGWATFRTADFAYIAGKPAEYRYEGRGRTFCGRCGTPLTFQTESSPDELDVTIGSLDEPQRVPPRDHTWVADRLPWIHLSDGLPTFPTARPDSPEPRDADCT